ncbi:MAG: glycosyltransferase [Eubacteriales bacterium]
MLPISVCIIAKNEEENIQTCLKSLEPYHFEIVVVDTGSTDRTKLIARRYTKHIYDFEWIGDFSAARNFSISKASNDWIFIIDCDETIIDFNVEEVTKLLEDHPTSLGSIIRIDQLTSDSNEVSQNCFELERIIHRKYYHYEGIIHENAVPIDPETTPFASIQVPVALHHLGYDTDEETRIKKQERNILLLEKSLETDPNNIYHQFQLGRSYAAIAKWDAALEHYDIALSLNPPTTLIYSKLLHVDYAEVLDLLGRTSEAIQFLEAHHAAIDDYADTAYLLGFYYYKQNNFVNAILNFIRALNCPVYSNMNYKTVASHYMLGLTYEQMGNHKMANDFYKNCLDYRDAAKRIKNLTI